MSDHDNVYSQIDVSQIGAPCAPLLGGDTFQNNLLQTLFQMSENQRRQNQLLEALVERVTILVNQIAAPNQQKLAELQKWQTENPFLTDDCRDALDALNKVHNEYMESMTQELIQHKDDMMDSEFAVNEFIDKFGPRIIQMNTIIQFLTQLGAQIKGIRRPQGTPAEPKNPPQPPQEGDNK